MRIPTWWTLDGVPKKTRSPVPIPPELVTILRDHLARFGTTEDGRLFRSPRTKLPISADRYTTAWDMARKIGFSPEQYASPLAGDPYDLRRAAVSTWLAAGVPPQEVAERAGHSVYVLLKEYARCLDGERDAANDRITDKLGGTDGTGDSDRRPQTATDPQPHPVPAFTLVRGQKLTQPAVPSRCRDSPLKMPSSSL